MIRRLHLIFVCQSANTEVFYRAIQFYLNEHPLLLNDLLIELSSKLDHARVVNMITTDARLPLVQKYLLFVQREDIIIVNEVHHYMITLYPKFAPTFFRSSFQGVETLSFIETYAFHHLKCEESRIR